MVEIVTQIDEQTYRELERRAQRRQRSVSEEAAELLRQVLGTSRVALVAHLQALHGSLKSRSLTPSTELIREDRERR
jgi:plasmid stability protein